MSLTTLLSDRDSSARRFLERLFPHTRPLASEQNKRLASYETIRPTGTLAPHTHAMLGRAIDYRLRFYFPSTSVEELVAWRGASRVMDSPHRLEDNDLPWEADVEFFQEHEGGEVVAARTGLTLPDGVVHDFFDSLKDFLSTQRPAGRRLCHGEEELLARYCVVLSCFEQIARSGPHPNDLVCADGPKTTASELFSIVKDEWAGDICTMSWLFYDRYQSLLSSQAILNPTFAGSADVGGADADLILDGCLVEIKATVDPKLTKKWLYQLLGYSFLDYEDALGIRELGIYFARQGVMLRWPLQELIDRLSDGWAPPLRELREQFQELVDKNAEEG